MADLVPSQTLHLVELFRGQLREVRFPDADAERLGASIDAVLAANDLVAHAEAALEAAREALGMKQQALVQETDRTLAYARVYAADRPELRAALDAMPVTRSTVKKPLSSGGRPRKSTPRPSKSDRDLSTDTASAAE